MMTIKAYKENVILFLHDYSQLVSNEKNIFFYRLFNIAQNGEKQYAVKLFCLASSYENSV
jgi:hypothetical protein